MARYDLIEPPPAGFGFAAATVIVPPAPLIDTPGAFFVSAERLVDWAIEAEEGDRCVYARVVTMVPHRPLRERAQLLAQRGVIALSSGRHTPGDGLFEYIARRTCAAWSAEPPPAPPHDGGLTPEARRVFELVCRRADENAPLENNRGIARACALRDSDAAAYQMRRLRELGFIVSKAVPVEPGRVVTVVETGAQTGLIGR